MGSPPHPAPPHRDRDTALHWAAHYGNRRIVRRLIDANADVDAQDDGRRAFPFDIGGWAAESRRLPCRRDLRWRWTPLHYAAWNGHTGAIEELLVSGAVSVQNRFG